MYLGTTNQCVPTLKPCRVCFTPQHNMGLPNCMLVTKPFLLRVRHGFVQRFMLTFKAEGRLGINCIMLHPGHFRSPLWWSEAQPNVNLGCIFCTSLGVLKRHRCCFFGHKNSIAFGKAPRREAESKHISQSPGKWSVRQSVRQASRQRGRQTHMIKLFSVEGPQLPNKGNQDSGGTFGGRMVEHLNHIHPAPAARRPVAPFFSLYLGSNPSKHKLLTPTPTPHLVPNASKW